MYISLLYYLSFQFCQILSTCCSVIQWQLTDKMSILFDLNTFPKFVAMSCETCKADVSGVILNDFWNVHYLIKVMTQEGCFLLRLYDITFLSSNPSASWPACHWNDNLKTVLISGVGHFLVYTSSFLVGEPSGAPMASSEKAKWRL